MRPSRLVALARNSIASARLVLPTPWWATKATLRMLEVAKSFKRHLPSMGAARRREAAAEGPRAPGNACKSLGEQNLISDEDGVKTPEDRRPFPRLSGCRCDTAAASEACRKGIAQPRSQRGVRGFGCAPRRPIRP